MTDLIEDPRQNTLELSKGLQRPWGKLSTIQESWNSRSIDSILL